MLGEFVSIKKNIIKEQSMKFADNYQDGNNNIKKMMDDSYKRGYPVNSSLWREGSIDKRFKVGDQNLLSLLYGDGANFSQRKFHFNLIRRHVNMMAGYQRQHRKSTIFVPQETKDEQLAYDYTDLSMWSENKEGFHEHFSQGYEGALDVGISLMYMHNDFSLDPVNGDLQCSNISYNNFLIDPWFKRQDLSDCNYIWRRQWITKEMAKRYLPERAKDIDKMRPDGMKDGRFPIQAEAYSGETENLFTFDEYYYADTREVTIVYDKKTGETVEWEENPDDDENELELTLANQPWLTTKKIQKSTIKLALLLGNEVMYEGPNLLNVDRFPFVPILCYHEPDIQNYSWRIQGIIRNLRDAQYLYNRRKIIELEILESQINSGYKYKVGAVTDEAAFRQSGQGYLIPVNPNYEMSDIERLDAPGIPSSMMEISRALSEDITKISGINEELLGSADDDKAGILAMTRQGASLTTLQTVMDKLDYSQKLWGSLRIEAIRKNWSNGKIRNILGRDADPKLRLTNTQKFDVSIEQGSYSSTQKQIELRQLLYFREMGIAIPEETIIRAASIQNKDQLIEDMQAQKKQQAEQQQGMMQQQKQEMESKRMLDFARAQKDMAGAKDLQASTASTIVGIEEIQASAEEKRTQAELNLVEKMINLEELDLRQLKSSIELAEVIRGQSQTEQEEILPINQEENYE